MTVQEIQGHLRELYAVDVSPDLVSRVTDAVLDEVRELQNRPLDVVYPWSSSTLCGGKIRDESVVKNKAVYLAPALDCKGHKHVLGQWIEQSEGAKPWLRVMNELRVARPDPEDDLHLRCHREPPSRFAQDHQDPRLLPVRRSRHKTVLPGGDLLIDAVRFASALKLS